MKKDTIVFAALILFLLPFTLAAQDTGAGITVDGAGNVGINTLTPDRELEVNGDLLVGDNLTIEGTTALGGNTTVAGNLSVTGTLEVTGSLEVSQTITVNGVQQAFVPRGAIIMWSGSTPPEGWALCDGNNSTPDLRNRFILGADPSGNVIIGTSGGDHTKTITMDNMPAHNHGGTLTTSSQGSHSHTATTSAAGGHNHTGNTGSAGSHTHSYNDVVFSEHTFPSSGGLAITQVPGTSNRTGSGETDTDNNFWQWARTTGAQVAHSHSFTTNTVSSHTHNVSVSTAAAHTHTVTVASNGLGRPLDIRPRYFVLAFIMKL